MTLDPTKNRSKNDYKFLAQRNRNNQTVCQQFKGEISDIQILNNLISFTETLFIGGQRIKARRTIPAESIVIVKGSLLLQDAWLAAGVLTLLVPQMKQEQEASVKGRSQYCGLVQVHKIVVITSPWSYCTVTHS